MSTLYPPNLEGQKSIYYVEFNRSGKENEFTLFKRQFFHSKEELDEMRTKCPTDFPWLEMTNEVHPWNIYTATYGPDGCMPDKKWVQWMVDALNHKVEMERVMQIDFS